MGINLDIYNFIYMYYTPEQIEKKIKELEKKIRCLTGTVNGLTTTTTTTSSTTTTTTTP